MLAMHLPTHLGAEVAAAHRQDLVTRARKRALLLPLRSARHRRRALRAD
jgi:hypothetical protein